MPPTPVGAGSAGSGLCAGPQGLAEGLANGLAGACRAARKLSHTFFTCRRGPVLERPQEAPGGGSLDTQTSESDIQLVSGSAEGPGGCGSLVFCMFCVENIRKHR